MNADQNLMVAQSGKAEDEGGDAQRSDDADDKTVACEQSGEDARPGIGRPGFGARDRQCLRHIDIEFVRRRKLAVGVAGAAGVAEIGKVVEIAIGKSAAHFHCRKHRAKTLAVAAGIADRHQAVGFFQSFRSVHLCGFLALRGPPSPREGEG
jgi:hypothetical protein